MDFDEKNEFEMQEFEKNGFYRIPCLVLLALSPNKQNRVLIKLNH